MLARRLVLACVVVVCASSARVASGAPAIVKPAEAVLHYQESVAKLLGRARQLAREVSAGQILAYSEPQKAQALVDTVTALGELRAAQAVAFLAEIIRFVRPDISPLRALAFKDFPAATALVQIGMPAIPRLASLLEGEATWMLAAEAIPRILGDQLAILALSQKSSFPGLSAEARERCLKYLKSPASRAIMQ